MDLKGILSISGQSGLFKLVAHAKNGIIVESIVDKKRMHAFSTSKISALEDIAIYTNDGDIALMEVFKNIFRKEAGNPCPDPKKIPNDAIKTYFAEILPSYDSERVYISDMKRTLTWYNLLQSQGLIDLEEKTEEKNDEVIDEKIENKVEE